MSHSGRKASALGQSVHGQADESTLQCSTVAYKYGATCYVKVYLPGHSKNEMRMNLIEVL